jgi:hypothetical protein
MYVFLASSFPKSNPHYFSNKKKYLKLVLEASNFHIIIKKKTFLFDTVRICEISPM